LGRLCCICVCWTNKNVGNNYGRLPSLRATKTIKAPLIWLHLSFFMGGRVRHLDLGSTHGWGPGRAKSEPGIERTITNNMKWDGRSTGSTDGFVSVHKDDHNYEGPND
jgi:hypothetical protein